MSEIVTGTLFALFLFAGLVAAIEVGRRIHLREGRTQMSGLSSVEGAVFGLMALILAFAFNGSASRFDTRRKLVVDEANAISSAYARLDLLPPDARQKLQQEFRNYVDARIALYRAVPNARQVDAWHARTIAIQNDIWSQAVSSVASAPAPTVAAQLLPAINAMTDAATSRGAASFIHPPTVLYVMLGLMALVAATIVGYAMGGSEARSWLHIIGFAAALALVTYVTIDLEYPRLGHFQITGFDQMFVDLRAGMR